MEFIPADLTTRLEDELELTIRFRNEGAEPIRFYERFVWGFKGTMEYRIWTGDGEQVPPNLVHEDWMSEGDPDPAQLRTIPPDGSRDVEVLFPVSDLVEEVGRYEMQFRYRPPLGLRAADGRRSPDLVGRLRANLREAPSRRGVEPARRVD